jgi:hypothetical protein
MKTLALIFLCLTLNTAVVWSADIHYVQTQYHTGSTSGTPVVEDFPVYVLLVPNEYGYISPVVFKTFDSKDMGLFISDLATHGSVARGSVLHYDPMPEFAPSMMKFQPTEAQIQALTDYCKKLGITLVVSGTG